ncbi:MAG: hypothetical protein AAF292_06155 [Pseudomonadota bacterium]
MSGEPEALRGDLSAWCTSYVEAFEAFDVRAIGSHWSFPATILTGNRQMVLKTVDDFNANTAALVDFYRAQDVAQVKRVVRRVFQMSECLAAMQVSDVMQSASGDTLVEWDSSYVLREDGNTWRAIFADANGEVNAWASRGTPLGGRSN